MDFSTDDRYDQANLSNDYFNTIDAMLRKNEQQKTQNILGEQADRGFLHSGDTFSRIANEVTNPGIQNRAAAFMPELDRSAGYQYEQRGIDTANRRQQILADDAFRRRMQEIAARASIEHQLAGLEADTGGGFDIMSLFGNVAGAAAGAYAGSKLGQYSGSQPTPARTYDPSYIYFNPNPGPYESGYSSDSTFNYSPPTPYSGGPWEG